MRSCELGNNTPHFDSSPLRLTRAGKPLSRLDMVNLVVCWLGSALPTTQPENAFHRVERRFDQVVEIPHLVCVPRLRQPEFHPNRETSGPRPETSRRDGRADSIFPGSFRLSRKGSWPAENINDQEQLVRHKDQDAPHRNALPGRGCHHLRGATEEVSGRLLPHRTWVISATMLSTVDRGWKPTRSAVTLGEQHAGPSGRPSIHKGRCR